MPNNKLFANALDSGFVNAWSNFAVKYCLASLTQFAETSSLKNEFEAWYCAPQTNNTNVGANLKALALYRNACVMHKRILLTQTISINVVASGIGKYCLVALKVKNPIKK
jgi:hypothetical protein